MKSKGPNCFQCRHFYITHETSHPYGCQAMRFKARQLPALVVRTNSGMECHLFTPKV